MAPPVVRVVVVKTISCPPYARSVVVNPAVVVVPTSVAVPPPAEIAVAQAAAPAHSIADATLLVAPGAGVPVVEQVVVAQFCAVAGIE